MSRIGVLADIHGNLPALETAVGIIRQANVGDVVVCGDVVGYGRKPNECCDMVRSLGWMVVAGNHDWAVAGLTEYEYSFSPNAILGIEYTKEIITPENLAWLAGLQLVHQIDDLTFVHATPLNPAEWYYLKLGASRFSMDWQDVRLNFDHLQGKTCFVGHSHTPAVFLETRPKQIKVITPNNPAYELGKNRAIIDVGSVGLPRNSVQNASLVVFDTESRTLWFKRFLK